MSARLRILHMLPDLAVGGGQRLVLRLVQGLDPARFASAVAHVRGPDSLGPEFRRAGAETLALDLPRGSLAVAAALPRVLRRLTAGVRRLGVDVIHMNNTIWDRRLGLAASALCGVPGVNTLHTMRMGDPAGLEARLLRRVGRGRVLRAVAVSASARDAWRPYLREEGLDEERVAVIPPGLELDRHPTTLPEARARVLREELGVGADAPLLLNVGRLDASKGQLGLVPLMRRVTERHPGARLVIAGEGPERPRLEAAIAEAGLGGSIGLPGMRGDVPELLALADLLVFPSRSEGFGLAVLEAMAAGCPVVAYDLPALREFARDGETAILVPGDDAEGLAAAVCALLDDAPRRRRYGEAARRRVEAEHRQEDRIRALEAVYEAVLAEASAR